MPYDSNVYLKNREIQDYKLVVHFPCVTCGEEGTDNLFSCPNHTARQDELNIKVRGLPWSKKNQIASQSLQWDSDSRTHWDGDFYTKECLKYMIAEAPWGMTDDKFLLQVGDELGIALEKLVPKAFGGGKTKAVSPVNVKKES